MKKKCTRCGEILELSDFTIRIVKPDANIVSSCLEAFFRVSDTIEVDIDDVANGWFDYETNCENISCAMHKTFSEYLQEKLNQPDDCYADGSKIPEELPF